MKVYIASAMKTDYPYKLQKPSTIRKSVRETASSFIMDSGIGDDVTNEEVLELAHTHNADYVVAKDYLHDQAKTTESVREFFRVYENHACDSTPLVPLQPPYDEHYRELDRYDHYVLGGMALEEIGPVQQLKWIQDFRKVAPDVYAHGLGVGGGIEFVTKAAGRGLLDSVDCSTPEQAAMFGKVLDKRLRQKEVRIGNGEGVSKPNKALAEFNSYQIRDAWKREAKQPNGFKEYCSQTA